MSAITCDGLIEPRLKNALTPHCHMAKHVKVFQQPRKSINVFLAHSALILQYKLTCCLGGTRGVGIDVGISSVESLLNKRIKRPPEDVLGVLSSLFVLRRNCNLKHYKSYNSFNLKTTIF